MNNRLGSKVDWGMIKNRKWRKEGRYFSEYGNVGRSNTTWVNAHTISLGKANDK